MSTLSVDFLYLWVPYLETTLLRVGEPCNLTQWLVLSTRVTWEFSVLCQCCLSLSLNAICPGGRVFQLHSTPLANCAVHFPSP